MLKWQRSVEQREEWRLLERPAESLWRGDILRLAHNPGLGLDPLPIEETVVIRRPQHMPDLNI